MGKVSLQSTDKSFCHFVARNVIMSFCHCFDAVAEVTVRADCKKPTLTIIRWGTQENPE